MVPRSSSRRVRKEVGEGGQREGQRGGWERRLSPWGPEGMAAMPRFHHSESRKLGFTQELTPICPSRGGRHRGLLAGGDLWSSQQSRRGAPPKPSSAVPRGQVPGRLLRARRAQCPLRSRRARPVPRPAPSAEPVRPGLAQRTGKLCGVNVAHGVRQFSRLLTATSYGILPGQALPPISPRGPFVTGMPPPPEGEAPGQGGAAGCSAGK